MVLRLYDMTCRREWKYTCSETMIEITITFPPNLVKGSDLMARKDKKRRSGKEKISPSQLQAYRARQEAVLSREEVERRREEERQRQLRREERMAAEAEGQYADVLGVRQEEQEDVPKLSPEQIAADYASVGKELTRIAIWGGMTLLLLIIIAVYMN